MIAQGIALIGLEVHVVDVCVDAKPGPARFDIVGLADPSIRETRVRVRSSLQAIGVELGGNGITISLTPIDIKKSGGGLDLAIAVGVLGALGRVPSGSLDGVLLLGEMSLTGRVRPVRGVLPALCGAVAAGFRRAIVARDNAREASAVAGLECFVADDLAEIVEHLNGGTPLDRPTAATAYEPTFGPSGVDLADIRGMDSAKRALEIAAAGQHPILLLGQPGAGKTMLARRLPTIMVPMTETEAVDVTSVHSVAGLLNAERGIMTSRPFRAPHHTVSTAGLLGGGDPVRPGEVSLAHEGVLLLDELPEFRGGVLDALREPLREGHVTICRSHTRASFPAKAIIVGAANPCPCGYAGERTGRCRCSAERIARYRSRIPRLFDLEIALSPLEVQELRNAPPGESSAVVRERVMAARKRAVDRQGCPNGELPELGLMTWAKPDTAGARRLGDAPTSMMPALRVARTIADLDGSDAVLARHVIEALDARVLDRTPHP